AIGVGDRLMMLEYSTYSVISPEGCATILWRSADKAAEAAEAMGLTAQRLKELQLVDQIIPEPMGGAHRDIDAMATSLKHALVQSLDNLSGTSIDKLLDQRYEHLMSYGNFSE
ncbi:MAG: acetyl-CoA carboxylase carboxyl transferase subunit alpha, partial [Gammaproteobacteria bacterium]|nr:acetyl-CoA carboxylase carboxyl transferase subunit alpha [Gammaproteobacteria bacterium]